MKKLVYDVRKDIIPWNSRITRILFFLNKIPYLRLFSKPLLRKQFNLSNTVQFNSGFFCHAPKLKCGNYVGLSDTFILAYADVVIGNNVSFSFRNMLITSTHDVNDFNKIIASSIVIGNNVWITSNVIILAGVKIGDNTIIGAGSVVTHDIPANVFAAGNPCRVIKSIRFNKIE